MKKLLLSMLVAALLGMALVTMTNESRAYATTTVGSMLLYNSAVTNFNTDPIFLTWGSTAYISAQVKDTSGAFVANGVPVNLYLNGVLYQQKTTSNGYITWIISGGNFPSSVNTLVAKTTDGLVASNSMTVYVGGATDAPKVFIASPTSGATISGIFPVKIQAGAQAGIQTVQLFVDGILKTSIAGNINSNTLDTYTINLDTTKLSSGSHTLQAKAINGYNVVGSSSIITVKV